MAAPAPHLLLFDIDGTLLDTGGAGMAALVTAREELYPEEVRRAGGAPELDLAGSTDSGIVIELFRKIGIPDCDAERARFYACYLGHLRRNLRDPDGAGRLLPGVAELLVALEGDVAAGRVLVGLLTGNIAEGARAKVEHYGVGGHFPFGSFGDDHHDRDELGPVAVARAESHSGLDLSGAAVTVVGDTPKDIRCARAFGARAVAVATGSVDAGGLAEHRPDVLLRDLADTAGVMSAFGFD